MSTFDKLKKLLAKPGCSASDLAAALAEVDAIECDSLAALASAAAIRDNILAADDARAKARSAAEAAARQLADLELWRAKIGAARAAMAAAGEQDRRRGAYTAAKVKVHAASAALANYREAAKPLLLMLRAAEEGFIAADGANNELPDDHAPLAVVDPRSVPGLPETLVSERRVDLWCVVGGIGPLGDEFQARVKQNADGSGSLTSLTNQATKCERRTFLRRERLPAVEGFYPSPIGSGVVLPDLLVPPAPIRTPWGFEIAQYIAPGATLAAIDAAIVAVSAKPSAAAAPVRKPVVELVAISAAMLEAAE